MHESARQSYLSAMGVDSFIPRCVLPNALVSPRYRVIDTATESEQNASDNSLELLNDSPLSEGVKALLDDFSPIKKTASLIAEPLTPLSNLKKSSNTVEFSYYVISSENFLIVCDVDDSKRFDELKQLVNNVLFALGDTLQNTVAELFVWPMIKSHAIDQSEGVARESLQGFISERLDKKTLLLSDSCQYINSTNNDVTEGEHIFRNSVHMPCFLKALDDYSTKKIIWERLFIAPDSGSLDA